jgi:uncharacterized protein (TIGR02268 family)
MHRLLGVVAAGWTVALAARAQPAGPDRRAQERRIVLPCSDHMPASDLFVAGGRPTAVQFEFPLRQEAVRLSGELRHIVPPQISGEHLLLFPAEDVKPGERAELTVEMPHGGPARLTLSSPPDRTDVVVKVVRNAEGLPDANECVRQMGEALAEYQKLDAIAGVTALLEDVFKRALVGQKLRWRAEMMMPKDVGELSLTWGVMYLAGDVIYLAVAVQPRVGTAPWTLERAVLKRSGEGEGDVLAIRSGESAARRTTATVYALAGRLPAGTRGPLSLELVARDGRNLELELSVP